MEADTLDTEVNSLALRAREFTISTNEEYAVAGELWNAAKDLREQVSQAYDSIIKKAFDAHKEAVAKKKKYDQPLEEAQKLFKARMIQWDRDQEMKRKAEEAALQAEANRKEEEQRLALAAQLEAAGQKEVAEHILEQKVEAAPVVLAKTTPKIEGFTYRTTWKFQVVDASKIPAEYMLPDMVKIGGVVRALKSATNIAGIRVYEEKV